MKKFLTIIGILCFWAGSVLAQTGQVSGTVTGADDGQPLPGVSVIVKGTLQGTITDVYGKYSFSNVPENATLQFTFVGMAPVEIIVGDRQVVNVVMNPSATELEEVVVTALGITREKKSIGYAAQEVKAAELVQTRQTDLNNALVGKISGVRFWGASGATFDNGTIVLRGTSSLTNARGGEPIYVLDGVITNVNAVNMDDVESINVLKGPAATAIYGSRGGNGAVIITSKKGSKGKGTVEITQSILFENVVSHANYQNEYGGGGLGAEEELMVFQYNPNIHPSYLQALNGVRYYDIEEDVSWGPRFDGQPYAPWYAWDPTHPKFGQTAPWSGQPKDNLKDLYKMGFTSTTGVSFSQSWEKLNARISFTDVERTGVVENSDARRRFFSVSADYNVNDRLSISADYKYTYRRNHNAAVEGYGGLANFMYSYSQWFHRNVNIKDLKDYKRPDGTFRTWNPSGLTDFTPHYHDNPFMLMNEIERTSTDQWNVISGTIKYDIIKKKLVVGGSVLANLRNSMGGGNNVGWGELKVPYNVLDEIPRYEVCQNSLWDTQMQGFLVFNDRYLDQKLDVSARIYVEQRDRDYRLLEARTQDGLSADRYYSLAASIGKPQVWNSIQQQKDRSVFGAGVIGWDNTYYLDFSLRNDWTSTLPKANNSYLYGGLSASIIVSNFFPQISWLNFWKIRGSLAQVGSAMGPYNVTETYVIDSGNPKYGSCNAMRTTANQRFGNIRPTISTSYEFGTEFRLFNNRFYADVNVYRRDAKDQIINLNVAAASGYTTSQINAGIIRNKGYELTLSGSPVRTSDIDWEVYVNWSQNKNVLVELNPNDPETTQYQLTWYSFSNRLYQFAEVGKPIGVIRSSSWDRSPEGKQVYGARPQNDWYGQYIPARLTADQKEVGNVQPDAVGGFGTSVTWKGLRLSMSFDYQIGGQVASIDNMWGEGSGLLKATVGKNDRGGDLRSDPWELGGVKVTGVTRQGTGETATYTDIEGYMNAEAYFMYTSSIWEPYIYDASYLKMRELSLSYLLPKNTIQKLNIGLSQARVSFVIQNPWLIYSGIPNVDASSIGNAWNNYISQGQSFSTRSWGFTLNLTF